MIPGEPYNTPFEIFNICTVAKHQNIAEGHSKDIQRFLGKNFTKPKRGGMSKKAKNIDRVPLCFGIVLYCYIAL